jgi:ABC-type multidrug transport system ATPase subunit
MKEAALVVENLAKRYGRVEAVSQVSFRVSLNTLTAFMGENGAGKTTTLKLILGFLRPDNGRLHCPFARVGYVPERPAFFPWLRGKDLIAMTAKAFGISLSTLATDITRLCDRLGFDRRLLDRRVPTYSSGNQKKFAYLQSLLIFPDLLVVDEPFSSLDPLAITRVRDIFSDLKASGKTLFVSSHLIGEMEKICDQFIIIKKGRTVVQDGLDRLKRNHVFIRLPADKLKRAGLERQKLGVFSARVRDERDGVIMLLEKSKAEYLMGFTNQGVPVQSEAPTLESLYFFFTSI